MNVFEILGVFRIDKATGLAALKELNTSGEQAAKKLTDGFKKVGDSLAKYLKLGAAAAVGAIAAAAVSGIKSYAEFDAATRQLFGEMGNVSEATKERILATIKAISEGYNIAMTEVAQAVDKAFDMGVPEENLDSFMETAAQLARVAGVDLTEAVASLGKTVQLTGGDFSKAAEYATVLWKAAESGDSDIGSLGVQLAKVAPLAQALGINFKQVAAMVATMAQQGIPAKTALSGIQEMFVELSDSTEGVGELFKDITEMSFPDFIEQGGDLADALALLAEYSDSSGISLESLFTSTTSGNAALALTGTHLEALRKHLEDLESGAVSVKTVWGEMSQGLQESLNGLKTWWENTKIEIGKAIAADIQGLVDYLNANKDSIKTTLTSLVEGLVGVLKWLIEHQTAVKVSLAVVAVGLGAILIVTHPLVAALALVTAAVGFFVGKVESSKNAMEDFKRRQEEMAQSSAMMAAATEASAGRLEDMRQAARNVVAQMGPDIQAALDLTSMALESLVNQFYDEIDKMEAAGTITALQASVLYAEVGKAMWASSLETTGEAARATFLAYLAEIQTAYGIEIPVAVEATVAAVEKVVTAQEEVGASLTDIDLLRARLEGDYLRMWSDIETAIKKPTSALGEFTQMVETAFAGLSSGKLAFAEDILGRLGGSVDELRQNAEALAKSQGLNESSDEFKTFVDDYVTQNESLVESAIATRDEITEAWADFASTMGTAYNDFLDDVSEMVTSNRELAKDHAASLTQIENDYADGLADIAADRDQAKADRYQDYLDDVATLNQQLVDGELTATEHQKRMLKLDKDYAKDLGAIDREYTDATTTAATTRTDALDDETQSYEDAKVSIGDILKEMVKNVLKAIREELSLMAAKELALSIASLLVGNVIGAAQHGAAAAGLGTAAGLLAISGFKQGGIATEEMLARIGDTGVNEAVIPLTATNLAAIGKGIAAASVAGGSTTSIGGSTFVVNVNNPVVRSDSDIRQIVTGVNDAFKKWERGQGRLVPVGV